jgi:hypothetical protein
MVDDAVFTIDCGPRQSSDRDVAIGRLDNAHRVALCISLEVQRRANQSCGDISANSVRSSSASKPFPISVTFMTDSPRTGVTKRPIQMR